jgi:hypothetical protein
LTLALMTEKELSSSRRMGASGQIEVDNSENTLDNVAARFTAKPARI